VKPYEELTYLGQVRRLRRTAQLALREYGLAGARLKLLAHGENTTFRIDAPNLTPVKAVDGLYVEHRYLLRVHRPDYQTPDSIASELEWLAALRREAALPVPEPVPTSDGKLLTQITSPGIPQPRSCSLFRWMRGRLIRQDFRLSHFRALGQLMARLHQHAAHWSLPPGFTRRNWDWEGLFGDKAGFNLSASDVWALVPQPYRKPFEAVGGQMRRVMDRLGQGPDAFGLVHADLFLGGDGNVLFSGQEARAIDFDDCGFGYWVYDLAVPLAHWQEVEAFPQMRDALLEGYAQIRLLHKQQLGYLDLFMAARHVSEILWAIDIAQVNPGFREQLEGWLQWAAWHVGRFLDSQHLQSAR
jgi:Ser/Thr protein kinase RdoA (MazF antagonist)